MSLIKQLYKDIIEELLNNEKIQNIYEKFKDYYGEENVDITTFETLESIKDILYVLKFEDVVTDSVYKSDAYLRDNIRKAMELYKNEKISSSSIIKAFEKSYRNFTNTIIVYFPSITLTNDYNQSYTIKDVYTKIDIYSNGKMTSSKFQILRTTFSKEEFDDGYMHSHSPRFGRYNPPTSWQNMCLGTGPIKFTCDSLISHYDLDLWELFCVELDQYLKVESISGGPYFRFSEIGKNNSTNSTKYSIVTSKAYLSHLIDSCGDSEFIKIFIKKLFHKLYKKQDLFRIRHNSIDITCSNIEFALLVSKLFIEYYNTYIPTEEVPLPSLETLLASKILVKAMRGENGIIYCHRTRRTEIDSFSSFSEKYVTFKGEPKYLKIVNKKEKEEDNIIYLLNFSLVSEILIYLLKYINYECSWKTTYYNEDSVFL